MIKNGIKKEALIAALPILVYAVNKIIKSYIAIPVIGFLCRSYLNDFLCGIIFCAYTNIILILFHKKPKHSLRFILPYILLCGLCWEYILPYIFSYTTSDYWDIVAYSLGGVVYYIGISIITKKA